MQKGFLDCLQCHDSIRYQKTRILNINLPVSQLEHSSMCYVGISTMKICMLTELALMVPGERQKREREV